MKNEDKAESFVPLRLTTPPRSQRDPEKTRERIMEAVVQAIAEVGFQRASGVEISKRAGVSWGAVQHHFGDKNGILIAVLEESFNRLARRLSTVDTALPLAERVSELIDRAWEHFGSDHFLSTYEILSHYLRSEPELSFQSDFGNALGEIWLGLFGDIELPKRKMAVLQQYTVSVLTGLAAVIAIGAPRGQSLDAELAILKETLVRELQATG